MNKQLANNIKELGNQMEVLGFDPTTFMEVKKYIHEGRDDFTVKQKNHFGEDFTFSLLHFGKPHPADDYVFKHFYQIVFPANSPDPQRHKFQVDHAHRLFNLAEAYHLSCGRSIYRPVPGIWLQFPNRWTDELKEYPPMPLRQLLVERSEVDMNHPEKAAKLIGDLQDGKRVSVTFQNGDHAYVGYIQVAPQFQAFKYFNARGQVTHYADIHKTLFPPVINNRLPNKERHRKSI